MKSLLQNSSPCASERASSTRLSFEGGEYYEGEVHRGLPRGEGALYLRDGSYYSGSFDEGGISNGEFRHFSGVRFEGSFVRDKFSKGSLFFPDGEVVRGVWGPEGGSWALKSGVLLASCGETVQAIGPDTPGMERGQKKVFGCLNSLGFAVIWERFVLPDGAELRNFCFGAEGALSYERKEGWSSVLKFSRKTQMILPFDQLDRTNGHGAPISSTLKLEIGLVVELPKKGGPHKILFAKHPQLTVEGTFEISKSKMKVAGELFLDRVSQGEIKIKKTIMKPLKVHLSDSSFDSFSSLFSSLSLREPSSQPESPRLGPKQPSFQTQAPKEEKKEPVKLMGPSVLRMMIHTLQKSSIAEQKPQIATSA